MTGGHYLWMPSSACSSVTLETGVDIFAWVDEDFDSAEFSKLVFPWSKVQGVLANAHYWDCSCSYCLSYTRPKQVFLPSQLPEYDDDGDEDLGLDSHSATDDWNDEPYDSLDPDLSFLDEDPINDI